MKRKQVAPFSSEHKVFQLCPVFSLLFQLQTYQTKNRNSIVTVFLYFACNFPFTKPVVYLNLLNFSKLFSLGSTPWFPNSILNFPLSMRDEVEDGNVQFNIQEKESCLDIIVAD